MTVVYIPAESTVMPIVCPGPPVEAGPACTEDDDECFLGALDVSDMTALQRDDPELRGLIGNLEGEGRAVPVSCVLIRTLPTLHLTRCSLQRKLQRQQHVVAVGDPFQSSRRDISSLL